MLDPTHEALDELCQEVLDLRAQQLLDLVHSLDKLRGLLSEDKLYVQRFAGLLRTTNKSNPLDCKYVSRCLLEFLKQPDNCQQLKNTILQAYVGTTPNG